MADSEQQAKGAQRRPWRDNIEAVTMAIIVAVMLKYFVVEAYKIPTGSMQPTLLGNEETAVFDRVIVDKLSYHYRDPKRFEVVVFKYPLDRSKNFIKRMVGMPGEDLALRWGDLFTRPDDKSDWSVLRRPRPIQLETWKRIDPDNPRFREWKLDPGSDGWRADGRATLHARGDGAALLPSDRGSVVDDYRDGYPGEMARHLMVKATNQHPVGDLRLAGEVEALAGCRAVRLELAEGDQRYRFVLPGPAAEADARLAIIVTTGLPGNGGEELRTEGAEPWRLAAGRSVSFAVQNMDDLLTLEIDGEPVLEFEIGAAVDQRSWFRVLVEGEGADLTELELYRDIYYTEDQSPPPHEWTIPEGHYFMLGDNTQDSSDSRLWILDRWQTPGLGPEAELVRGGYDGNRNPRIVPGDPERGTLVWMRDEWGELLIFPRTGAERLEREMAPLVPRHLIAGRAVLVFWPHSPSLGVWRLKWVH